MHAAPLRRFTAACLSAALLVVALPVVAAAQTHEHDHTGSVPAGAKLAVASGRWSSRATWGGAVPAAHATVVIPAGIDVLLDVSPPHLSGLTVEGVLRFDRRNLTLHSGYVMVHGALRVGTESSPFLQRASIILDGPAAANVHGMGTSVLGVMGGTLDLHGRPHPSPWTRLARPGTPGSWRITTTAPPSRSPAAGCRSAPRSPT